MDGYLVYAVYEASWSWLFFFLYQCYAFPNRLHPLPIPNDFGVDGDVTPSNPGGAYHNVEMLRLWLVK